MDERQEAAKASQMPETASVSHTSPAPPVLVEMSYDRRVSLAHHHTGVRVVKQVRLRNVAPDDLANLTVSLITLPTMTEPVKLHVPLIRRGETYNVDDIPLELPPDLLAEQREREQGHIHVVVRAGRRVLFAENFPLTVEPFDVWTGLVSVPEMLAAFVVPADPAVQRVLGTASDLLKGRTGEHRVDGYRSGDPSRVLAIANAVYDGLMSLDLTHLDAQGAYERAGQKVRSPSRILETRLGTSLDLSLFAVACLEKAGLHPILFVLSDRMFVGVWLIDAHFQHPVSDERRKVMRRVDSDEVAVFDPDGLTMRPQQSFPQACASGRRLLARARGYEFALDVHSARRTKVEPLPFKSSGEGQAFDVGSSHTRGPTLRLFDVLTQEAPESGRPVIPDTPATRIARWKQRLLDLTLRNRLINYRDTRRTIPLVAPDLSTLEDALATGLEFEIHGRPDVMDQTGPLEREQIFEATGENPLIVHLTKELVAHRVHSSLTEQELDARLLSTYRAARASLQESGANTLYLALGFLSWFETPGSDVERLAPILLVPAEITRESVRSGFKLRLIGEEARINVTLLEKLHADFDLNLDRFNRLPEDDRGLDVRRVLQEFRAATLPFKNWSVLEEARLGLFTFQKFVMWLDLEDLDDRGTASPVVEHLVDRPDYPFDPDGKFPDESHLDERYKPDEVLCPLDADASQLAAILAASHGRSFVLQGPPGTGKSQTITNLISHCVATGKRVLFVSEKMAALDVVLRRLESVGLGPFCLALHSNRARKKDVLEQLARALDVPDVENAAAWKESASELANLRRRLNDLCAALHDPRYLGHSAFEGLARLIALREEPSVRLVLGAGDSVAPPRFRDLQDRVEVLRAEAESVGDVANHGLRPVQVEDWEPALVDRARRAADSLFQSVRTLRGTIEPVATAMMLPNRARSMDDLEHMDRWRELVLSSPGAPRSLVTAPNWDGACRRLRNWLQRGRARDVLRGKLLDRYHEDVLRLPHPKLIARLEKSQKTNALFRWFVAFPARRRLRKLRKGKELSGTEKLLEDLQLARRVAEESEVLADRDCEGARLFGAHWKRGEAQWGVLERMVAWTTRLRDLAVAASGDDRSLEASLLEFWVGRTSPPDGQQQRVDPALQKQLAAFEVAVADSISTREQLRLLLELDETTGFGAASEPGVVDRMESVAQSVLEHAGDLRSWSGYARARREAREAGLGPLVIGLERGNVPAAQLGGAFERSFYEWWIGAVFAVDPRLGEFSSTRHQRAIDKFREVDRALVDLTAQAVIARLASRLPSGGADVDGKDSEMGVLARELRKKSRHKPLRRLFAEIPNVLARTKPVLLMSPLSVAQYLGPAFPTFDLVVFDEASQIPVWDAIGALSRAKQAIVVGDSRQLPPTRFFQRDDLDDMYGEDEVEDLESVLDECLAARLPSLSLKWHYRSRHESLIAFSNYHYYENKLFTFPSTESESAELGVRLELVKGGLYDRGRTRTNRKEAEALVSEIVRRLWDPFEADRSFGVVTFNLAQQTLIEDLLEKKRLEHPEIEPHFAEDAEEPVFVKNLENVQGDERDVIFFSIGYGPDESGRIAMNFGPLNRDGGERRLNVAVTRARGQVVVYSSLRAEDIDLARTRSVGVRHLRNFLDYAARGTAAFAEASQQAGQKDWHTAFERDVQFALEEKGYTVRGQVGCSGYRIDLGVQHPDDPDRFVLGIECDGAMYRSGRTARDRDRLRHSVLSNLGWRLHRVWIVDWWFEPEKEVERIVKAIDTAIRCTRVRTLGDLGQGESEDARVRDSLTMVQPEELSTGLTEPMRLADVSSVGAIYEPLPVHAAMGKPADIHSPYRASKIQEQMHRVIDAESPITVDLLLRRVAEFWGSPRLTRRVAGRLRQLLDTSGALIREEHEQWICWRADQRPETYRLFRRPGVERAIEHIPVVEIANAAEYLLGAHVSIERTALARETARLFGIARLGPNVRHAMELGIARIVAEGRAVAEDDMVRMP